MYSQVCNKKTGSIKRARWIFLSFITSEQGVMFHLLHENLREGWKINQKYLNEHALLKTT